MSKNISTTIIHSWNFLLVFRKAFLFFCLLSIVFITYGQQPVYFNYTVKDGLPSNTVYSSFQDSRGYMWFGTDRGVVRYDGYAFAVYTTSDGLADNVIFDIFEDSSHRIWFACNNGNACYYFNNKFYNKNNHKTLAKIAANGPGLKTIEDKDHNIYVLTHYKLFMISPYDSVTEIKINESRLYSSINLNEKKEVVVLAATGIYNITTYEKVLFGQNALNIPQLNSKAVIWNGKLYHTQKSEFACSALPGNIYTPTEIYSVTSKIYLTQSLLPDQANSLLVGTQNGLFHWDLSERKIISHSFERTSISSILRDDENNLWITSLNNGIFLSVNPKIRLLNEKSGLNFNNCYFIDKLLDGTIVFGSDRYRMAILRDDKIYNIKLPEHTGEGKIEKIRIAPEGNYYLTSGSVLMKVNKNNFSVKVMNIAARDIFFDKDGRILMVAGNSLIEVNNHDIQNVYNYLPVKIPRRDGFAIANIKANGIYKGIHSNNIYIYGLFGVKTYANDQVHSLLNNKEALSKNIYRVVETPDGLIWLASNIYGVLVIYRNQLITIDKTAGLPSNYINSIYADKLNQIWVAGAQGLSKITYKIINDEPRFQVLNYSQSDGLISKNIYDVTKDGDRIYAATEEGICIFEERDLNQVVKVPVLNIESVFFNEKIKPDTGHYVSDFKNNSIRIKYAGLSFASFGNIQYKYRMKGLENNWSYTYNTVLEYPAIPPGDYVFEIMAFNSKGDASEIKSLAISIIPPFWRTCWFIAFVLLFSVLILYLILQRWVNNLKKAHQIKEQVLNLENQQLEAQRKQAEYERELLEIKNQALRLHMNPHFIFNAINSIQGFYASGEIEKARTYIGKFSGLLRMILMQSKKEYIHINEEINIITLYLDLNKLRFENKFDYELIADKTLLDDNEEIPPMIIQPFIENSIIHGIAPMKSMGKIKVSILSNGDYIQCMIEDNGVGRNFSQALNKDRIYESTGISVTQKRIDLLNGINENPNINRFEIIDLYNDEGISAGTKVVFYILKNSL